MQSRLALDCAQAPTATESPAAADLPPFQVPDDLLSETLSGPVRAAVEPPPAPPVPVAPAQVFVAEAQAPVAATPTGSGATESSEKIRVTSTVVSSQVESMPSFSRETAPDPRGSTRDTDGRPLFHVRPDGGLEIA